MGQSYLSSADSVGGKQPGGSNTISSSFFLSPITSQDSTFPGGSSQGFIEQQLHESEPDQHFSPLLSLPLEILYKIIEIVYYDDYTNSINSNLEQFSKTVPLLSRKLNQLSLRFLYKYAVFNRPHAFDKFLKNLINQPDIGKYVEFMDFQTFTSVGLGRTGRMNQEIQMVTSKTISQALSLNPNLVEFLASENIQDDMNVEVLDYLFNKLPKIQALDFCGASSESFARAFQELQIDEPNEEMNMHGEYTVSTSLDNLFKISFHDCSNIPASVFEKVLPHLKNLRRLDLNHTSITSTILFNSVPSTAVLSHLSLARCSKLTTKDLINFLVNHPAVVNNSLKWLNLQIDSNVVSPLSDVYLLYTVKHLKASNLKYLNLGGMPVNGRVLHTIKKNFVHLESLSISHSSVSLEDIHDYLEGNTTLKYLDISGVKSVTRVGLTALLRENYHSSLLAVEADYKLLWELAAGDAIKIIPIQQSFIEPVSEPHIWKFYDNEGRRSWLYRITSHDPDYKSTLNRNNKNQINSTLTYYDLETGKKIETKRKYPQFLKYGSRKINCSIGYFNLSLCKKKSYIKNESDIENVWPVEFSQRGIYNYYSLNIK